MRAFILLLLIGCQTRLDCPEGGKVVSRIVEEESLEEHCVRWDGLRHGPFRAYKRGGSLSITGSYRDGLRDGIHTTYYRSGDIRDQSLRKQGRVVQWIIMDGKPVGR